MILEHCGNIALAERLLVLTLARSTRSCSKPVQEVHMPRLSRCIPAVLMVALISTGAAVRARSLSSDEVICVPEQAADHMIATGQWELAMSSCFERGLVGVRKV